MAYICEICEKKAVSGSSQKHRRGVAGKRWKNRVTETKRLFKPNLQKYAIDGKTKVLCAKCIKRLKKNASESHLSA